jgi:hypothetical protein
MEDLQNEVDGMENPSEQISKLLNKEYLTIVKKPFERSKETIFETENPYEPCCASE